MNLTYDKSNNMIVGTTESDSLPVPFANEYGIVSVTDWLNSKGLNDNDPAHDMDRIQALFAQAQFEYEPYMCNDGSIEIGIEWGDWKHSHAFCDDLMKVLGWNCVSESVTDEDGSDCYSATHIYVKGDNNG